MSADHKPGRAALWMIGAVISFTSMAVAGREAGLTLSTFEIMTYRSAIGFAIILSILIATGALHRVRTQRLPEHVARNVAHFTGQNLWFFAVSAIPLAQVFALEFTSPLWVIGLAALFLGERLTHVKIIAGVIGFLGVIAVLRPGASPIELGHVTAALAAIGFAVTAIFTKRLTATEDIMTIMFWLTALQLVFGVVTALIANGGTITWPQGVTWVPLTVISLAGLAAHYCLTRALSLAPASVVMPLDFIRLPLIAVIGAVFYAESLSVLVIVGAAMIFGANYLNILASQRGR